MSDEFTFTDVDEQTGELEAPPSTFFGSSDEFFRRFLRYSYRRTIGLPGKGEFVWRGDWWRVEDDGRVIGYGWMDYSWGDAEVLLAVDPASQSQGVGTFILDRLDEEGAARGLNYLYNVIPAQHPDKSGLKRWLLQRGFAGAKDGDLFKRTVQSRKPTAS